MSLVNYLTATATNCVCC